MDLIIRERRGPVLILQLNRPQVLNALDFDLVREVRSVMAEALAAKQVRALVLTGTEKAFCAGADVAVLRQEEVERVVEYVREVAMMLADVSRSALVTIAAVEGCAIGAGADLAVACDVRIAGEGSIFRFPGMSFGVVLGTRALARLVGPAVAKQIVFGQMTVSVDHAKNIGLVNEVVPAGDARKVAIELAERMANIPRDAVAIAKGLLSDDGAADVRAAVESVRAGNFTARFSEYWARRLKDMPKQC